MKIFYAKLNFCSIVGIVLVSFCHCYLVDLSHAFNNDTLLNSEEEPLHINIKHNGTKPGSGCKQVESMCADTTHSGTHVDAPCHGALGKWCITDIPLERLVVPGITIDISGDVQDNPDIHLTVDHVLKWEGIHGPIPDGCLLLVGTGWSKRWPDRLKYLGSTSFENKDIKFPAILPETARWIVHNRNVVGVGIDSQSIEMERELLTVHGVFLEENIYMIENMNNILLLPPTGFRVMVMPTKLESAGAAPARVVAEIPGQKILKN